MEKYPTVYGKEDDDATYLMKLGRCCRLIGRLIRTSTVNIKLDFKEYRSEQSATMVVPDRTQLYQAGKTDRTSIKKIAVHPHHSSTLTLQNSLNSSSLISMKGCKYHLSQFFDQQP